MAVSIMPRPPHDRQAPTRDQAPRPDDAAWPSSITELQRQAQERAARDEFDDGDAQASTDRVQWGDAGGRGAPRDPGAGGARRGEPRAAASRARPPLDDALSTARLRARQGRKARPADLAATRRADPAAAPEYREPLDVRAGQAIVGSVRRAGGFTLDYFRNLRGKRLWTMVAVALVIGAGVGGVAAFGMRRALSHRAPEPATAAAPDADRGAARPLPALDDDVPAPAAPAPRPAPPPPARTPAAGGLALGANAPATLVIVSEPFGADIAVNGQGTGMKTPDTVEGLAPGRTYKVTLTRKGYRTWEKELDVIVGGPQQVSARLEPTGRGHGSRRRR